MIFDIIMAAAGQKPTIPTFNPKSSLNAVLGTVDVWHAAASPSLLMVGAMSSKYVTSTDNGASWAVSTAPWSSPSVWINGTSIGYSTGIGKFIAATLATLYYYNGSSWAECTGFYPAAKKTGVSICVGPNAIIAYNAQNLSGDWISIFRSTNGTSFTNLGNIIMNQIGVTADYNQGCVNRILYLNNKFVATAWTQAGGLNSKFLFTSTDGTSWTSIGQKNITTILGYANNYYFGAYSGGIYRSSDLVTWSLVLTPSTSYFEPEAYNWGNAFMVTFRDVAYITVDGGSSFLPMQYGSYFFVGKGNYLFRFLSADGAFGRADYPPYV